MNKVQKVLSGQLVSILCTLFAILTINAMQQVINNFGWDNSFSIAAAKSIADGHGYSLRVVSPNDLSKVLYEPLNKWPPGYSVLLLIIHAVFRTDWIHSFFILNAIGLTFLVLVFRKMLSQLDYPVWVINIAVFYFGFINHSFYSCYFTDIFALLFFMTGCSLLLQFAKTGRNLTLLVFSATMMFAFSAYLRYLYMGIAFIPLVFLFYYGYTIKKVFIWKASAAAFLLLGILVGALILFQYLNSGAPVYLNPTKKGFFPEQLLSLGPVVPASFMSVYFVNLQISRFTPIPLGFLYNLTSVLNLAALIWMGYAALLILKRKNVFQHFYGFYAILVLCVGSSLFLFLGILTVIYSKVHPSSIDWVYFKEVRYFAPLMIMILQFLIFIWINPGVFLGKKASTIFRIVIICIMAGEITHNLHFMIRQFFISKEYGMNRPDQEPDLYPYSMVKEISKRNKVVVCSYPPDVANFCSLVGAGSLYDISLLKKPLLTSEPIVLITVLIDSRNELYGHDLLKDNHKLVYQNAGFFYYIKNIPKTINSPDQLH
jgi:hypothetical protein